MHIKFVVIQLLSRVLLFETPWTAALQAPCPSISPRVYSNSCPLSWWCSLTILSFVTPFSFCLQSFPASECFPMQRVGFLHQMVKVLELQLQHQSFQWISSVDFLWDWLVWSPASPRDSEESPPPPQLKSINSSALKLLHGPVLTAYMTAGKTLALTMWTFVNKMMSLLFNMPSRFVIAFLPRSKCLLISWLQSPSRAIFELRGKKISLLPLFPLLFVMKWWDQIPGSLFVFTVEFQANFCTLLFHPHQEAL